MSDQTPSDAPGAQRFLRPAAGHPADRTTGGRVYDAEGRGRPHSDDLVGEVDLLHYVRILYKRRWPAFTALAGVMLVAAAYLMTAQPLYEATTRLLIEAEKQNVVAFKPVIEDENAPTDAYYQTLYKLLESRALVAKTIDTLKLWDNLELCASCRTKPRGVRGLVNTAVQATASRIAHLFGQATSRTDGDKTGETPRTTEVIDAFLERLIISPVKDSRLVDVRFRSIDATLTARVTDAHARGYIDRNLEFRFQASKEASDWLGERLNEQREKVEQSEAAVQEYREQNDGVSLEDKQNIVIQKLNDLNAAVTKAKTQRIEKEALYRQILNLEHDRSALDTFPAILSNTYVQQLKHQVGELERQRAQLSDRLGEKHPDMVKVKTEIQAAEQKLTAEIEKVVLSVKNDYLAAAAQERSLIGALEAQKSDALAVNRKSIEGNVLKRDAEGNHQLYEGLMQRAKETGVSGELRTSNIRVVDLAEVPRVPVSPNKTQFLLIAIVGGTLLGVTLAFFFENLDDRISTPEQIAEHLGLASLGLVPKIPPASLGPHPLISNGVPLNFAEAYRTVRTGVLFSMPQSVDGHPTVLVVTSTGPGEGKTVSASNLAVGIALAGQRTLLIDCDLRRPKVHEMFEIDQEPGLSNLIVGNAEPSEAICSSGVPGLSLLSAGRIPPNPSELLASQRFKDFLATQRPHFDWIVLDSAPVLAVTDASIIANLAHGVVFVVAADLTSYRAAAEAVSRLVRADGRVIGAVLNWANTDRHPYYYARYYRSEYAAYYAKTAVPARAKPPKAITARAVTSAIGSATSRN